MRALDLQIIGRHVAVKWEDGGESFIPWETLRRACPCAACRGETDILGIVHQGPRLALTPQSFDLSRIIPVGGYAVQPVWADGHATGLFSFEYLRGVAK